MAEIDAKLIARCTQLTQQSMMLSVKAAPVIAVAGLLQQAMNLNQELTNCVTQLLKINNESEPKGPEPDAPKVPGSPPQTAN